MASIVLCSQNDVSGGLSELALLPEQDRHRAGIVASVVTLLTAKKQKQLITQVFKDAANYYQDNKVNNGKTFSSFE